MIKICKWCAAPFEGKTNAVYCDKCKDTKRVFIGIDGEGYGEGNHTYGLLSVGDRSIQRDRGLHYSAIFQFLWDCYKEDRERAPQGMSIVYAGFFLKYDFTQWTKTLKDSIGYMLFSAEGMKNRIDFKNQNYMRPVVYDGWEISFMNGMKQMQLSKVDEQGIMYINDCGPTFNEPFLNVIDPNRWEPGFITQDEYDTILEGKNQRGTNFEGMKKYNVLENELLARVLNEYEKGFRAMGLNMKSTQWYGPGVVAQEWLNSINAPICKGIPDYVNAAAQESYYAGWMEIYNHGHVKDVYSYDINSAYPYQIVSLPCLDCGYWTPEETGDYVLVKCYVQGSNREMGALPKRLGRRGMLTRPMETEGWYWKFEIEAAERAGLVKNIEIEETYSYVPSDCGHVPFAALAGLYDKRREASDPSIKNAYKLVCNSVYGKLAQTGGKYSNWVYASLITAGCRVQILDAIASHPMGAQDVVMVATDAVYFRSKHETLSKSNQLGDWKETHWDRITLFLPGMYWGTNDGSDGGLEIRSRGVSKKSFEKTIAKIDRAFKLALITGKMPNATFSIDVDFDMITPQQAILQNNWDMAGMVLSSTRKFKLRDNTKKRDITKIYRDRGVLRSPVKFDLFERIESAGYSDKFRSIRLAETEALEMVATDWEGSGIRC